MRNRTILVTGGAGFIGSTLTEALLKHGDRVIVLDDFNDYYSPTIKHNNLASLISHHSFKVYEGDIREAKLLDNIFEKHHIDVVVHLAARAGVRPSLQNPKLYYDVNVMGTLNVLEGMREYKIPQIVFASSSSVYGNRKNGPFKETDSTDNQISPYGATKKTGELMCATYAHLYGIKSTGLRFFTAYGPKNRPDMANYIFMNAIIKNLPITMFGDGLTGRDYTYIDDIVAGILAAINKPQAYEIINLGISSPVLLKDLIKKMELVTGLKAKIDLKPRQPGDVELTFADNAKAKKLLGWSPRTPIDMGLKKIYMWFKESGRLQV